MMINLLVACPSFNEIDADTAISWAFCNSHTQQSGLLNSIGFMNPRTPDLTTSRTLICKAAISADWTHLFCFDHDVIFPPDTITRLVAHDLPIVCGLYRMKELEYKTASRMADNTTFDVRGKTGLHEITKTIPIGCTLIQVSLLKELGEPWFGGWWEPNEGWYWDDAFLCRRIREAGYKLAVDCDLSREIGHKGHCRYYHHTVQVGEGHEL